MERRLAAILLTDMVGYSRLMGLDEEGTIARQKAHREEIFDPKISAHRAGPGNLDIGISGFSA